TPPPPPDQPNQTLKPSRQQWTLPRPTHSTACPRPGSLCATRAAFQGTPVSHPRRIYHTSHLSDRLPPLPLAPSTPSPLPFQV
ncbi:hypothetical protein COCCADRAFT_99236, partial [Bipolaris zeicola 26-R-13]